MPKLHELLPVEGDLSGAYDKVLQETSDNFRKHPDRYQGSQKRVELFDADAPDEAPEYKNMDDTVHNKLDYTSEHIIRYFDCVLQKEATNQNATGDIIIDGVSIAENVPATFLLGLESKLTKVRNVVYRFIPTLQPGIHWEKDETQGPNVYKRKYPEENFRTKKVRKNHIKAPATDKHPAQVEVFTEDEKVARIIKDVWCGMPSSAEKSEILKRLDTLIQAVKKARQRANSEEVVKATIGKKLFDFIHNK